MQLALLDMPPPPKKTSPRPRPPKRTADKLAGLVGVGEIFDFCAFRFGVKLYGGCAAVS